MNTPRRHILLAATFLASHGSLAMAQSSPLDVVAVYVVPLDDCPEDLGASLARLLQQQLGIRIKASLRLAPLGLGPMPGTNQYASEDILAQAVTASRLLPEAAATTYRLFLTTKDINTRPANFRFQFSTHNRQLNSSVLSMARLLEYANDKPVFTELSASRLVKMAKRAIDEVKLGWTRSGDPRDLMYAPIMGLEDLDRIGYEHSPKAPDNESPKPQPASGSV